MNKLIKSIVCQLGALSFTIFNNSCNIKIQGEDEDIARHRGDASELYQIV